MMSVILVLFLSSTVIEDKSEFIYVYKDLGTNYQITSWNFIDIIDTGELIIR